MKKKIIVFGATGHLGAYTIDYLSEVIDQNEYGSGFENDVHCNCEKPRNKYDHKNMYLNVSKSNNSKNHQSIDSELNNHRIIKKAINQLKNNHNMFKNNLINALLGCGNNKKKKISKDIFIKKDKNSIIDSIDLKNCIYKDNTNTTIFNNYSSKPYNAFIRFKIFI